MLISIIVHRDNNCLLPYDRVATRFGRDIIASTYYALSPTPSHSQLLPPTLTPSIYSHLLFTKSTPHPPTFTPTHSTINHSHPFLFKISSHLPTLTDSTIFLKNQSRFTHSHPFSTKIWILWPTPTHSSLKIAHNYELWHFSHPKLTHLHPRWHTLKH